MIHKINLDFLLNNILNTPKCLAVTDAYSESEVVRYKQYGRYDVNAVSREGRRLLAETRVLEAACDEKLLRKWNLRYFAWEKKLCQLKYRALIHGELSETGQIVLYRQAIHKECVLRGWDYDAYFDSVLVHERVHYLQRQAILQKFGVTAVDKQVAEYNAAQLYWFGNGVKLERVRTVKETLAEFVRYLWCLRYGHKDLAQGVMQQLIAASACYPSYPYAGVRGLCTLHGRDAMAAVRAWYELWDTALLSWQKAYSLIEEWKS